GPDDLPAALAGDALVAALAAGADAAAGPLRRPRGPHAARGAAGALAARPGRHRRAAGPAGDGRGRLGPLPGLRPFRRPVDLPRRSGKGTQSLVAGPHPAPDAAPGTVRPAGRPRRPRRTPGPVSRGNRNVASREIERTSHAAERLGSS